MSRFYTVPYTGTLTLAGTDADLFELLPVDDKPIRLRGIKLGQTTEIGDAAEEGLRISIIRLPATVTSGSGGSTVTPVAIDSHASAAGFTSEANNSTVATTSGTAVILEEFVWNVRISPMEMMWALEEMAPIVYHGEALVVRCQSTVLDDLTIAITAQVEEI